MVKVPFQSTVPLSRRAIEARDERRCQVAGCDRSGQTVPLPAAVRAACEPAG